MDTFQRILNESVAANECVGVSARITHKGKDLFRGAAGFADKENGIPFNCDNLIRMFSSTKLVTGATAMMLYEKGYFHLDEPVAKYLPAFANLKVIDYDNIGRMVLRPAKNILTIRHLFTMTSGISYHIPTAASSVDMLDFPKEFEAARAMAETILRKAAGTPNLTSEMMLEAIASMPLAFEPGTRWLYGPNSDVLAGVCEAITKMRYSDFLKENLFDPLGMKDTCYRPTPEQLERLAVFYDYIDPANVVPYDQNAFNVGHRPDSTNEHFVGALYSTLDDYSTFMQMLANKGVHNGKRILGANTIKFMASDQLTEEQYAWLKREWYPAGHSTWGMMCRVVKSMNHVRPMLMPGSFGWGGWAGTQSAVDPDNELTITLMVQRVPSDSYGVLSKLMQTTYGMI